MGKNAKRKTSPATKESISIPPDVSDNNWMQWLPFVFLSISAIIFIQTRFQLLAIPMERDEGSFAYISHWLLHGKELYTDMLDSKLPGLYILYGFFTTVFGYNATGIHIGLLLSNIVTALLYFLLVRDLFDKYVASVSTAFLLILICSPNVVGFATHATQLLLPFVIGGCWLFLKGIRSEKRFHFFLSGLMIGFAFIVKQQAALFGVLLAIMWWMMRKRWNVHSTNQLPVSEWLWLGIGGILPVSIVVLYFAATNRLDDFIAWTYSQPLTLADAFTDPWYVSLWSGIKSVLPHLQLLWIAALMGVIVLFIIPIKKEHRWFTFLFSITCLASVAIGVGFYKHYFVVVMPAIALCAGITLYALSQKAGKFGPVLSIVLAIILISQPLVSCADYYFSPAYAKIHQEVYYQNMFPEIEKLGRELAKRVPGGNKIAVLGSEPEILVAANREGCSKYLMVYSLFVDSTNAQVMQNEYYNDIATCDAEYLVFDIFSSSWVPGFESTPLHQKNMALIESQFALEGVAEFQEGKPGKILWGEEARKHKPQSAYMVFVFKRK